MSIQKKTTKEREAVQARAAEIHNRQKTLREILDDPENALATFGSVAVGLLESDAAEMEAEARYLRDMHGDEYLYETRHSRRP